MSLNVQDIKKLREETGAGILDVKQALQDNAGDYEKAKAELAKKGLAKAEKRAERETGDGLVYSYIHGKGKVGSMVMVGCETDFVAKTDDFKALCHELAIQIVSIEYNSVEELLADEYIKDPSKKVSDLVAETIAKTGENVEVKDFSRLAI
jgi:elongation factor Ts